MSFTQAIQSAFEKYFTISGRASRSEYWYFVLFCLIGAFVFGMIDGAIFGSALLLAPISTIFSLVTFVPSVALGFRRLHDTNRSAWWLLLSLVPVIGWVVLLVFYIQKGTDGENTYGADPLGGADASFAATPAE